MKVGDLVRFVSNDEVMVVLNIIGHGCDPSSQVTAITGSGVIVKSSVLAFKIIDTEIENYEE